MSELLSDYVWHDESFIRSTQRAVSPGGHAHSPSEWAESRVSKIILELNEISVDPLAVRDRISWRADDADTRIHIISFSKPSIIRSDRQDVGLRDVRVREYRGAHRERRGEALHHPTRAGNICWKTVIMWSIVLLCWWFMTVFLCRNIRSFIRCCQYIQCEWRHFFTLRCFRSFIIFCAYFQREESWIWMIICIMYKCAVLSRTPPLI